MLKRLVRSREFGILIILIVMLIALEARFRVLNGQTFFSLYNIERIASDFSFIAIAAVGAAIVIISGGIDLSSGSLMGLGASAVAYAYVTLGLSPVASVQLAAIGGLLFGAINGILHAKAGLPPFIATLGMLWIARGIAFTLAPLALTIPWTSEDAPPALFRAIGDNTVFCLLFMTVIAAFAMAFTRWGRYVYAIGGNEEAARFSGVSVDRMKIGVYALAGLMSGVAGAALALSVGSANSGTAKGYELQIIAAAVVGGTSLAGGHGTVFGAVLGALVLQLVTEILTLYDVKDQYIQVVYGLAIVVAGGIDQLARHGWVRRRLARSPAQ